MTIYWWSVLATTPKIIKQATTAQKKEGA